jgi:hypothetical protein
MSYDGLYYFDGSNSYKISDRVRATLLGYNTVQFPNAVSSISRVKNRYFLALPNEGTQNGRVLVWDFYNNAFSIYSGMSCSDMAQCFINGQEERVYFSDYNGFTYRIDTGSNDYPLNTATAVNAYYWTNWRTFDDLVDSKGIPNAYLYYQNNTAQLTFAYSYDFEPNEQYTQTFSTSGSVSNWGTMIWGTGTWYGSGGGAYTRRDLTGRGKIVRFKFANSNISETFRIDGFGSFVHLETHR